MNVGEPILGARPSLPPYDEYIEMIKPLWGNRWLTNMGEMHNRLEKQLAEYLGVPYMSLCANGHMALEMVIQAMGLKGEAITTPFTFASTTHAIVRSGLEPVFCDINPKDYTIDADKIEGLITSNTSAIIPVHVYGNICDVEKIERIAKEHNLKVIYDAAHAFGITVNGVGIGCFGDASMFSFHATKVFHTVEGGGVSFSDGQLVNKLGRIRNFGICSPEMVSEIGTNGKMNEFEAAMGLCNLKHIKKNIEKRKAIAERYRRNLAPVSGLSFPASRPDVVSNYSYFPIFVDKSITGYGRDEVAIRLAEDNIHCRKYFSPLTNDLHCYEGRFSPSSTPIAKKISDMVLTLPMYADLALGDVDRVCAIIQGLAQ